MNLPASSIPGMRRLSGFAVLVFILGLGATTAAQAAAPGCRMMPASPPPCYGYGPGFGHGYGPGFGHGYGPGFGPAYAHPYGMQGQPDACPHYRDMRAARAKSGKALGVLVNDLRNAALDEKGLTHAVHVARVLPDGVAAKAGLAAGDLIVEFDGKAVYSSDRLRWLVRKAETGREIEIKVLRGEQSLSLKFSFAAPTESGDSGDQAAVRHGT